MSAGKFNLFRFALLAFALTSLAACQEDEEPAGEQGDEFGIVGGEVDENGKPTFSPTGDEEVVPGKADAVVGRRGLPLSTDDEPTAVWTVTNQWEDTDTPAARQAGIAWGEDSGLTWEEKFGRWVASLEQVPTEQSSSRMTYQLTTPWGKTLPAPALECAESAIFLRVTFASWYNLPFFIEAADAKGRIYFGHFGMRHGDDRFARTPNFRERYPDFSDQAAAVRDGAEWPSDPELARKKIPGSFDDAQPMLGDGAHAGAYFDEIYLNKRVGHFMITTLAYFGSIHLADSRNTFNVAPEAVSAGDVLVERWQRTGIGHVLLVMQAREAGVLDGEMKYEAELASGSMPRRQPVWESAGASKRYFELEETGGEGFAELGGGLKRWRIAKPVDGRWTNVVPAASRSDWINSRDLDAIAARPERFGELLVELTPAQKRDVLLEIIAAKRDHLRRFPASCAARIAREDAFDDLYALMQDEFDMSPAEVDEQYRRLEDYVFAELEYAKSKTCCWNSSTSQMYDIAMEMNLELQRQSDMCADVVVFKNRDDEGDGFELFRQYAADTGRADQWVTWRADESCPQADVAADTEADHAFTPYCDLGVDLGGEEPVMTMGQLLELLEQPVAIPDDDPEGVSLTATLDAELTPERVLVDVAITHTYRGDLEIDLVHPTGAHVTLKESGWDSSQDLVETFEVPSMAGLPAAGEWTLTVSDRARQDTGEVTTARITLQ